MKTRYGIEDEAFIRGDVPMTKREIRAMLMVQAKLSPSDWVLDIGAGTGSITIEAALAVPEGHVYAVERFHKGIVLIQENCKKFGLTNVSIIEAKAPDGLVDLPALDVIFVGGSGGALPGILDQAERLLKPGGRCILTSVTVETTAKVTEELRHRPFTYEGFQMQVNRLRKAGSYHLLDPLSPITIITAVKNKE